MAHSEVTEDLFGANSFRLVYRCIALGTHLDQSLADSRTFQSLQDQLSTTNLLLALLINDISKEMVDNIVENFFFT